MCVHRERKYSALYISVRSDELVSRVVKIVNLIKTVNVTYNSKLRYLVGIICIYAKGARGNTLRALIRQRVHLSKIAFQTTTIRVYSVDGNKKKKKFGIHQMTPKIQVEYMSSLKRKIQQE